MIDSFQQWAARHGNKLQFIPIGRLQDIKTELEIFSKTQELNDFQKWIISDLYQFDLPAAGFTIKSILIIAIPHPFYANVEFTWHAKKYNSVSLVSSDFNQTEKDLHDFLAAQNYHIIPATNIPLKRLAVQSGLAVYGRNNITYVEGLGSLYSFASYFSDAPCENDVWMEVRMAERCTHCWACFKNCPTGAIRKDRFIIDNERCLSNLNESPGEFPAWLPESVHHCLYDCLKCQIICPMDKAYLNQSMGPIQFSEDETELLLSGGPLSAFSPALKQKSKLLGLDPWLDNLPRNLKVLFDLSDLPLDASGV
jgi:epoxyqueuosine reductase